MKKHFLLLLMAFFSLAGWAQTKTYDLSDETEGWTIKFYDADGNEISTNKYTGASVAPVVKLVGTTATLESTQFTVTWSPSTPINVSSDGYTATITSDMTTTFGTLKNATKKFYVLKSKAEVKTGKEPALASDVTISGGSFAPYPLITNTPEAYIKNGADGVVPVFNYKVNTGAWSATIPTATGPGEYNVYYKVVGTDNYNGVSDTETGELLGKVTITGQTITGYTAPKKATGLTFSWNNSASAAIDQALITAGTVDAAKGTMMYSFINTATGAKYTDWSTSVPTASAADTYTIRWKIVGTGVYANEPKDAEYYELGAVTIAPATPVVTAATGANLTFTGEAQTLISDKGSATLGASSVLKYKIYDSTTQLDENDIAVIDWDSETAVAYENVKGTTAGYYYIQTIVPAGGNYNAAEATKISEAVIAKPSLFTAGPAAADLTWNNTAQQLVTATVKQDGVAKYYVTEDPDEDVSTISATAWKDITEIKKTAAGTYYVYYKVSTDANYAAVEPTLIPNTKIKKKVLSVKVNDVTKVYDATVNLKAITTADYSLMGLVGTGTGATAPGTIAYAKITDDNAKNAGEHAGVVTVDITDKNDNYDYNVIPGNLTVTQRPLTVTADDDITADYGVATNISKRYTVTGLQGTDELVDNPSKSWIYGAFSVAPELTSNATGTTPAIGKYTLSFTKGTLKENGNYKMSTTGDGGYVIPDGAVFEVKANADTKIVITVLPHTQEYTGVAESWANIEEGTDYVVSGLMTGDALATAPTFTRANPDKFDADTYALTASGATIADDIKAKYPGGIVYNGSTFKITKKVVTATVAQQTVKVDAVALPDPDAWSVTGLTEADAATGKSILEGVLAINGTTTTATAGLKENGIKLTINDKNYTFKDADGNEVKYAYGKLNVIDVTATLFLDDSKADNLEKIAAKDGKKVNVQIQFNRDQELGGARTWEAGQWNTMVLPFEISVAELSKCLTYAIVNVINPERTVVSGTGSKFYGKLTMTGGNGKDDVLAANKPFLVKTAQDIPNETIIDFGSQTIVAPTVGGTVVDAGGDCKFVGTYEKKTVTKDDDAAIWFMLGNNAEWAYIKADSPNKWDIVPFAAYIDMSAVPAGARNFTFYAEELDGSTTAIKSISTDNYGAKLSGEGWYNLNGAKLNGAPTKKGIYIQNGKKVIVK